MSRLKKLRDKARQLETVLSDLKSRDFMQSPKIQELMAKVTVKGLKNVPFTGKSKNSSSTADKSQTKDGSKSKASGKEKTFRGRLKTLENQISPKIAKDLVQTIMKKADEIRSSYWNDKTKGVANLKARATTKKSAAKNPANSKVAKKPKSASKKSAKASVNNKVRR